MFHRGGTEGLIKSIEVKTAHDRRGKGKNVNKMSRWWDGVASEGLVEGVERVVSRTRISLATGVCKLAKGDWVRWWHLFCDGAVQTGV